ncbi:MarR family winged helix-turn-helix transcriptional regulator [Sphaerisporangium corydalis]|uniref:MarR family winged helix-turn-helix transcriptional regulator n=1 Tax=Sphaerisporangium corydalis TaxID=1441875 RepID=A0ABV9EPB4_9ACTN|nr:MarR family transcriptional regulator [Sphaerisporangium corydalis]
MEERDARAETSAVRRGTMRLARRLRTERPEGGLSGAKLSVLGHLYRRGGMTPKAIAELERVQAQSMTRVLAELQREGMVSRDRDPHDGRQSLITITPQGRDVLVQDMASRDEWLARAMERHLSPAERRILHMAGEIMERLAEADTGTVTDTGTVIGSDTTSDSDSGSGSGSGSGEDAR